MHICKGDTTSAFVAWPSDDSAHVRDVVWGDLGTTRRDVNECDEAMRYLW